MKNKLSDLTAFITIIFFTNKFFTLLYKLFYISQSTTVYSKNISYISSLSSMLDTILLIITITLLYRHRYEECKLIYHVLKIYRKFIPPIVSSILIISILLSSFTILLKY